MQTTIKQLHRKDYYGENLVTSLVYSNSMWGHEKKYISNKIGNIRLAKNAIVFGNGTSREQFEMDLVEMRKFGKNNEYRLQTYGCNRLYKDFEPDFLVCVGDDIIDEIVQTDYCDNHIVYANHMAVNKYPGKFNLVPQNPQWNAGTIATYLACFDQHTRIFLLGFDQDNAFWTKAMMEVFYLYSDVEFIRVMPTENHSMPEEWKYAVNFRQVKYQDFTILADL